MNKHKLLRDCFVMQICYSGKFVCIFCGIADHVLNQLTDMLAAGGKVFGHLNAVLAAAEIFRAVRGGFIISVGQDGRRRLRFVLGIHRDGVPGVGQ